MRPTLITGAACAATLAACGGSGSSQGNNGGASGGGGTSRAALVSTCTAHYTNGDFGTAVNGGSISSSAASTFCGCAIPKLLSSGRSADEIASDMQSAIREGGGSPSIFGLEFTGGCPQDPTTDPGVLGSSGGG